MVNNRVEYKAAQSPFMSSAMKSLASLPFPNIFSNCSSVTWSGRESHSLAGDGGFSLHKSLISGQVRSLDLMNIEAEIQETNSTSVLDNVFFPLLSCYVMRSRTWACDIWSTLYPPRPRKPGGSCVTVCAQVLHIRPELFLDVDWRKVRVDHPSFQHLES